LDYLFSAAFKKRGKEEERWKKGVRGVEK